MRDASDKRRGAGRPACPAATRAFTLVELLVVLAVAAMLLSILLPSASHVRDLSKRQVCQRNLGQVAAAFQACLLDLPPHDDPRAHYWVRLDSASGKVVGGWLIDALPDVRSVLRCPSDDGRRPNPSPIHSGRVELSYTLNDDRNGFTTGTWSYHRVHAPSSTLLLIEEHESDCPWNDAVAWQGVGGRPGEPPERMADVPTERHLGGGNLVFFDGRAERMALEDYKSRWPEYPRWCPE